MQPVDSLLASNVVRRARVLVVDDEPQVLVALEDVLGDRFHVTATDQPERALRVAEQEADLAVVLSDQRMPGMTGDQLLARMRACSPAMRILCTGYADISAVVRSVNEGQIFAYVTKPWEEQDLQLKVQQAAEHFWLSHELASERQLLSDLMQSIPDGIFFKDVEQRFTRVNPALVDSLGVPDPSFLLGKKLSELFSGDTTRLEVEAQEREILQGGSARADVLHREPHGSRRWFSSSRAAVRSPDGRVIGLVGVSRDVTDRMRTEQALRHTAERLRLAFLASNAGLFDWNLETGETMYSPSVTALSTHGASAAHDFSDLESRVHPEDRAKMREAFNAHLERRAPLRGLELRVRDGAGDYRWFELHAQAAWDDSGRATRLVGAITDITEKREQMRQLARMEYLTFHDELTGLPNRALLGNELERQLASASTYQRRLALLVIDVVRFRHVNETLGRRAGDELLQEIARRLGALVEPKNFLARLDADKFAVLMTDISDESAVIHWLTEVAMPVLHELFMVQGTELRLSTRAGIALFPSDGDGAEPLIGNAEAALKQAGQRAQPYLFYAPSMNSRVSEKLRLETRLRRAIASQEFELFYQPKVDLETGLVAGLEALIRWRDPETGLVPPNQFIPLLEETALILPVGQWVFEEAVQQRIDWLERLGHAPRVAVNVSALQLAQPDFMPSLAALRARHPLACEGIDLELTESVLMDDVSGNADKLRAAKALGFKVQIDDFGTGYSSLGYLSRLPLDALKIDRSFIDGMTDDPQQLSIVTAIISLAHSIDLKVVAEGVETVQQAQLLRRMRCDEIQGFLLARPAPAADAALHFSKRFDACGPEQPSGPRAA